MFTKKTAFLAIIKNLLKAFLAIALSIALIFILSSQISIIAKSLLEKKNAAALLQKKSQALASLRTELAQIGANEPKIDASFPPDDNAAPFLAALQSIATQSSIKESVQLNTPVGTPTPPDATALSRIDYIATLSGTAVTLIQYLKGYETLPYFAGIRSIAIEAPAGWDGNSTITINAFFFAKQTVL